MVELVVEDAEARFFSEEVEEAESLDGVVFVLPAWLVYVPLGVTKLGVGYSFRFLARKKWSPLEAKMMFLRSRAVLSSMDRNGRRPMII